jgi:D-sedoheptulose 7-phosphate isomerase
MKNDKKWFASRFKEYSHALSMNDKKIIDNLAIFKKIVLDARDNNKTIYFAGNGASTTIASHAALDFTNQLAVKCHALNDPNFITCFANDFGYDDFMARSIKLYAESDDVIVLISSSGQSQNVINAAKVAKEMKCKVVTLSGFDYSNPLQKLGDVNLWLDSNQYNIIECIHMFWLVMVCDVIVNEETELIGLHGRKL